MIRNLDILTAKGSKILHNVSQLGEYGENRTEH